MQTLPFREIGDFVLQRVIQDGPYSLSIQGYQKSLHRPVFIKLLKPHIKNHEQWLIRFEREAKVCARLKHPNIVDVYTIGELQGYTYMAMEFVQGLSLKQLLQKMDSLPATVALEITKQVVLGLNYAHEHKIVHRDLKPGNVMLDIFGSARITDFGLAYLMEAPSLTQDGSILGTPAYMAPEQITGETITPATDFFALGATLYEMLTGTKPFAGENYTACMQRILNETPQPVSSLQSGVPERLDIFVLKLLDKEPSRRMQSGEQILVELEESLLPEPESRLKSQIAKMVKQNYEEVTLTAVKAETRKHAKRGQSQNKNVNRLIAFAAGLIIFSLLLFFGLDHFFQEPNEREVIPKNNHPELKELTQVNTPVGQDSILSYKENEKASTQLANPPQKVRQAAIKPQESKNSDSEESDSEPEQNQPTTVVVQIEPWARVTLDGEVVDTMISRTRLSVSQGTHQLVLTHPNFAPKVLQIDAKPGTTENVSYSFYDDAAYLAVEVRPWAAVHVDGKFVDNTPLKQAITVSPGEHLLELKNPYFETYRQILQLQPGDTLTIKHVMRE